MSHDRSDRVRLDPAESRCEPAAKPCACKSRCARYQAYLPLKNPVLQDYTMTDQTTGGTVMCDGFLTLSDLHTAAQSRPTKPFVKGMA